MHYHALHVVFFFFPMLYSPAVFLCFSIPFSLSLFSFLLMAPKKFVPSKNPIRRRGSSSSSSSSAPSLPDFVRFRDEKAQDDFFENFSNKAIHSKHSST